MAQQGVTKFDKASKHILIVALSTTVLGVIAAAIVPGVGSTSALNGQSLLAIFSGAAIGAVVTAHDKIGNWLMNGVVTGGVTVIFTSLLLGAWEISTLAIASTVFVGSFLSTVAAKYYNSKRH